jgi:DNA-binding Xre family transcriptional regulator
MTVRAKANQEVRREFEHELLYGEIAETVGALLAELGISQKELAERLGLSESRVSRILGGTENMTLRRSQTMAWCSACASTSAPRSCPIAGRDRQPRMGRCRDG